MLRMWYHPLFSSDIPDLQDRALDMEERTKESSLERKVLCNWRATLRAKIAGCSMVNTKASLVTCYRIKSVTLLLQDAATINGGLLSFCC